MKKWLLLVIVWCTIPSFGQEVILPVPKYSFKNNLPSLFEKEARVFYPFSFEQEVQQSILLVDSNLFNHLKTKIEFNKPSDLKRIQKIDYQQLFFGCPPANSKDMMISSVKHYLLNKYVFSLFMNNIYE
ncbi:hypothetical protein WFZ85_06705 [Flavobacterium sp. j3]|uniref:Uncharacterized protein n=1 Tax=Flavobacterium aureirubrum TaxID=3133147 RepID=A0ABU9N6X8_9FLAO